MAVMNPSLDEIGGDLLLKAGELKVEQCETKLIRHHVTRT